MRKRSGWIFGAVANAYALVCLTDYLIKKSGNKPVIIRYKSVMERLPWKWSLSQIVGLELFRLLTRVKVVRKSRYGSYYKPTNATKNRLEDAKETLKRLLLLLPSPASS